MRGTQAKKLRAKVYGNDFSPRARNYSVLYQTVITLKAKDPKTGKIEERKESRYTLSAGPRRALYQNLKKSYKDTVTR
jgi:hypothetical protein